MAPKLPPGGAWLITTKCAAALCMVGEMAWLTARDAAVIVTCFLVVGVVLCKQNPWYGAALHSESVEPLPRKRSTAFFQIL